MAFLKALYFAALVPPASVKEEVRAMKMELREKYGAAHALKLPAHITLIPPVWIKNEEERAFLETLESIAKEQAEFPVKVEGMGHFNQRVIFIEVKNHEPVNLLFQKLMAGITQFVPDPKKKELHPHITLATRDLTYKNFPEAWLDFKSRTYSAGFKATTLTLFKHNGKTWDVFQDIPFLPS